MPPATAAQPRLVAALARVARERPFDAKLLVAPSFGVGRELLRCLGRGGHGWVGFEVTTLRALALRIAGGRLIEEGLRPVDSFARQALLDEALDGALASGPDAGFGELSEGVGFRESVHGAVLEIRGAGVAPKELRSRHLADLRRKLFLVRVLERYEGLLRDRRAADDAAIFRLAAERIEGASEDERLLGGEAVLLLPGLGVRGLQGRFLAGLGRLGARVPTTDPVVGLPAPESVLWAAAEPVTHLAYLNDPAAAPEGDAGLATFHAASVTDELREVLRRIVEGGHRWDQVELIAPSASAAAYGSALHALTTRLSIPVTYAVGLPVGRTRPGRVVQAYFDWIGEGFQADPIRRLLEAGDLRPPRGGYHAPASLARRFRALRIGWGRRRYRTAIRRALAALDHVEPGRWESAEGFERRVRSVRGELEALRSILFPTLKATPSVPDRLGEGGGPIAPAELAHGLRAFLKRVPAGRGPDAVAREEVLRTLDRIEATLRRRTNFEAALTILRRHLDLRVRAPRPGTDAEPDDGGAPWLSEGGHLHLSDFEHGGYTGRPITFVLGLDADHVPGSAGQDPVLPDADRRSIASGALATTRDRSHEQTYRLAALLSRLRGRVTLSYGAWDASAARSVGPSPVLLQAFRVVARSEVPTFEDLHRHLGALACPVPRNEAPALDADDVWMGLLADDGVLRPGLDAVRAAFPRLDRGLVAAVERAFGIPGAFHGVVEPRPDVLDARRNEEIVLSASRLESLGACPLRYLHGTVLRIRPPDDPELDPDRWLDPLQRGSLLHAAFERTLATARQRGVAEGEAAFEVIALGVLERLVEDAEREIPSPGEGVRLREAAALREDMRSFVRMIREHGALWARLEMRFGVDAADAVRLPVDGGELRLRGAIDRVDEDLGGVHVVDYKTGVPRAYEGGTGTYNGGRRLQHAIYSEAAERLMGREVATGAYHFPTRRGQNLIVTFPRVGFLGLDALLGRMMDTVRAGAFVPTDDPNDCRYCDFAAICRARTLDWGRVESPLAAWSEEMMAVGLHESFRYLKAVRDFER